MDKFPTHAGRHQPCEPWQRTQRTRRTDRSLLGGRKTQSSQRCMNCGAAFPWPSVSATRMRAHTRLPSVQVWRSHFTILQRCYRPHLYTGKGNFSHASTILTETHAGLPVMGRPAGGSCCQGGRSVRRGQECPQVPCSFRCCVCAASPGRCCRRRPTQSASKT